jgi:hypothetical protein
LLKIFFWFPVFIVKGKLVLIRFDKVEIIHGLY